MKAFGRLRRGLIVSCQPPTDSPLNQPRIIAAMAAAAERQGAAGVRINSAKNIRAVRRCVSIPVIGIEKLHVTGYPVYITPSWDSVRRVSRAGADIIAVDCTDRPRPGDRSLAEVIQTAKKKLGAVIMADVATLEQGTQAAELGADLVATTLHGYTEETRNCQGPAYGLLESLVRALDIPVILEGRVQTTDEARKAFEVGAYAVVVGAAITDIERLIRKFVQAIRDPGSLCAAR